MKIAIGAGHAGFHYKEKIIAHLRGAGHEVADFGIVEIFLSTPLEGGRQLTRIQQLDA